MRPPKLRLRTLMVTVALLAPPIAVVGYIVKETQRPLFHGRSPIWASRRLAKSYAEDAEMYRRESCLEMHDPVTGEVRTVHYDPNPRKAAYFTALAAKYRYAADHPSEPVAPDPPEPD